MGGAEIDLKKAINIGNFSAGASTGCNNSGITGVVSNQLVFCGGNNITLSESINGQSATITIIGPTFIQSTQPSLSAGVSDLGNTLGTTGTVTNQIVFAGGNNITLSQSSNVGGSATVTIIGPTFIQSTQPSLSAGVSNLGNTLGTTGTVSQEIVFVGGSNVTLSQSINADSATITIDASFSQSIQSYNILAAGTQTADTTGTVLFQDSNNVSFGMSDNSVITATATFSQSVQTGSIIRGVSLSGNNTAGTLTDITSGTLYLAGGNNITISQNGNSLTFSGPNTVAQSIQPGIQSLSAGTTNITTGEVVFSNSNNISFGADGQTITASASFSQSIQTESAHVHIIGGNTTGTTASMSTGTIELYGGNNITLSQNANSVTISAASQSQQLSDIIRDVNIGGNTSGTTVDISSGTLVLVGGYNITLSQVGNAITFSGGEQLTAVVSNLGNTAGTTGAPVSMDKLIFVGGNNITLSQSYLGEDVTITFNAQSQSLQTSGLFQLTIGGNTSGTGALVSSGTLTLAGGPNITVSQQGNAISISANPQTIQTNSRFNLTVDGNTTGTLILVSSGVLTLAGGNNITLSQQGNAITISGPNTVAQSVQPAVNLAAGTETATSGTIVFLNSNNFTFGMSGSTGITASFSESIQTQSIINVVSISGTHTSGTLTGITSGTLYLAGGDNITLSQEGNSITISAGSANVGTFSGGMSTEGNTAGTTGLVEDRLIFVGSDNITLSQSVNGQSATITIFGATVAGGSFFAGASSLGNTIGNTGTVSQQLVLVGGDNITLSGSIDGNSATLTINAFIQSLQTDSRFNLTIDGNTAGTSTLVSSGVLTLAGGNKITLSQNGNAITISGANQSAQTGSIVQAVVIASNTSGTTVSISSGTLQLAGGYNITLSQNQNSITISGPEQLTAVVSNLGNTAGTTGAPALMDKLIFVGGNNITLSQSYLGEDVTITFNAQSQSLQTESRFNLTMGGNTTGTGALVSSGVLTLVGGNNITLSQNAGNVITISAFNQTVQTSGLFNLTMSGNTTGTGALISSGILTLAGGPNITLSQAAGNIISISGHPLYSAGMSDLGNTNGTTGVADHRLIIVGGNNISISQSLDVLLESGTITINGPDTFAQSVQTGSIVQAVVIASNTSGTTASVSSGTLQLAGGNSITLFQNANSITISGPRFSNSNNVSFGTNAGTVTATASFLQSAQTGISSIGVVGSEQTFTSGNVIFSGSANITLSTSINGASQYILISAHGAPAGTTFSLWEPFKMGSGTSAAMSTATLFIAPASALQYVTATRADMIISIAESVNAALSMANTISVGIVIYTMSNDSIRLQTVSSGSTNHNFSVGSGSSTNSVLFTGPRAISVPINVNMTPGQYWIGMWMRTSASAAGATNNSFAVSQNFILGRVPDAWSANDLSISNNSASTTAVLMPGYGVISISRSNTNLSLPVFIARSTSAGGTTNADVSWVSRIPYVIFRNFSWPRMSN